MPLKGRIVIVTGAGSGIGRETAKLLAAEGTKVAIADVSRSKGESTAEEILRTGGQAFFTCTDVSNERSVAEMVERVLASFGPPFGLVNNAGIINPVELTQMSLDEWDRILAVNLRSVYLCTRAVLPLMRNRGEGSIVNIASVHAYFAFPGFAAYDASKAGIVALTRTIALENGSYQIRANVICPGYVKTPLVEKQIPQQAKDLHISEQDVITKVMLKDTVDQQFTTTTDVAEVALFFASFESNALTGQSLIVSHGWYMQ